MFTLELSRFRGIQPNPGKALADVLGMQAAVPAVSSTETTPDPAAEFDPRRRFVRIVEERSDGMVEFEFAVGEPQLFVEMILPREAFEEFCAREQVKPTRAEVLPAASGGEGQAWTLHEARSQRLDRRQEPDEDAPPA